VHLGPAVLHRFKRDNLPEETSPRVGLIGGRRLDASGSIESLG
jgi:hypothetical protein